ncbi:MAG: barstar family protein [Kofleriaceae bacterium]
MRIDHVLQRIGGADVDAVRLKAEQAGSTVFVLPAAGIVDRSSFFEAVRGTLPLDPPLIGSHSWDALADSLWEGLHGNRARSFVVVWKGTRAMSTRAPHDFEAALQVLSDVAKLLADSVATKGRTKALPILIDEDS